MAKKKPYKLTTSGAEALSGDAPIIWAANDIGLEPAPNEVALALASIPAEAWTRCHVQDGSEDVIRLVKFEGKTILNYIRGSDRRCLLGLPVFRGSEPKLDRLLAACREISARVDISEAEARAQGWWVALDPRRPRGEA